MTANETKPKVFISYSHPTGEAPTFQFVADLAEYLRTEGMEVYSDQDLSGGESWEDTLRTWRTDANILLFVYSKESKRTNSWCHKEIAAALDRKQPIIPLRFDDSWPLPESIREFNAVDFRQGITVNAGKKLVGSIRKIYGSRNLDIKPQTGEPSSASKQSDPSPLPTSHTPKKPDPASTSNDSSKQMIAAFAFGIAFLLIVLGIAIFIPNPSPFAYTVFRIVLALAAAGVGAFLPGTLKLRIRPASLAFVQAGGALGLFVIIFFFSPALIPPETISPSPTPLQTLTAPAQIQLSPTPLCTIDSFEVSPQRGTVGTPVTMNGSGTCAGGVRAIRFLIDDNVYSELVAPSLSAGWDTTDATPGEHTISIEIATNGDNNWSRAAARSITIVLDAVDTAQPQVSVTTTLAVSPTAMVTETALYSTIATPNAAFEPQFRQDENSSEQAFVPAGTFIMGDIRGGGYIYEQPPHNVYTDSFWIDRNLVTNAQFSNCPVNICGTPRFDASSSRQDGYYTVTQYQNYPVIEITWEQASAYCRWAGGRLPTEAEFEKAAGWDPATGEMRLYPWGLGQPNDELANFMTYGDTSEVGDYPLGMSAVGAYDMAGNVWQWTSDWYGDYSSEDQVNPTGVEIGTERVVRGGSWSITNPRILRVANRGKQEPDRTANETGFRCIYDS